MARHGKPHHLQLRNIIADTIPYDENQSRSHVAARGIGGGVGWGTRCSKDGQARPGPAQPSPRRMVRPDPTRGAAPLTGCRVISNGEKQIKHNTGRQTITAGGEGALQTASPFVVPDEIANSTDDKKSFRGLPNILNKKKGRQRDDDGPSGKRKRGTEIMSPVPIREKQE